MVVIKTHFMFPGYVLDVRVEIIQETYRTIVTKELNFSIAGYLNKSLHDNRIYVYVH